MLQRGPSYSLNISSRFRPSGLEFCVLFLLLTQDLRLSRHRAAQRNTLWLKCISCYLFIYLFSPFLSRCCVCVCVLLHLRGEKKHINNSKGSSSSSRREWEWRSFWGLFGGSGRDGGGGGGNSNGGSFRGLHRIDAHRSHPLGPGRGSLFSWRPNPSGGLLFSFLLIVRQADPHQFQFNEFVGGGE